MRSRGELVKRAGPILRGDIDMIDTLRQLMPERAVTWSEALSLAERQAAKLLRLQFITEPPIPQFIISSLPGVAVDRRPDWPTSGMAVRARRHWQVVLCANEPLQRQRFSLAHEFKHILDAPFIDGQFRRVSEKTRKARAERLCNVFAACLLMPRGWIKRDWCAGQQDLGPLSRRYCVSEEALSVRLAELGLIDPPEPKQAAANTGVCQQGVPA